MHRLRTELRNGYNLIRSHRDALVSAQQRKDELTNLIVHDLKNPLTNIIGHADFIQDQAGMEPERMVEMVRSMGNSARVMMRMVMNMLDIMRSEDGVLQPKVGTVNVSELLDGLTRQMGGLLLKKKIALQVNKAGLTADKVPGDVDLLRRTLDNLVDNAIRSAPSGSTIAVEARTAGVNVEVRVRDEGPGVPAEHRENIFDKYVQLGREDPTHPRSNLGLGLTFCRLAVEAHNGRIWVEDNKPQGACFCLQLPCETLKPAEAGS
jgi:K+-sensing histidine kinase KdpD